MGRRNIITEARKTINPDNPNGDKARWLPQEKWRVNPKLNGKELPVGHKDVNWPVHWQSEPYSKYPIPYLENYDTHHDEHSKLSPTDIENLRLYYPILADSEGYVRNIAVFPDNSDDRKEPGKQRGFYAETRADISRPLPKNATADEFREYGFAALMSDDDDQMYAALDSLLDSDVGRSLQQEADRVYAEYEREQERIRLAEEMERQADAPVMRMGRNFG